MKDTIKYLKEQILNLQVIVRISQYTDKDNYQSHYLGMAWRILNPAIQIGVYYLIFGVFLKRSTVDIGLPYLPWMFIGMTVWFFCNGTIIASSRSISSQVALVSKMNFPISIMPTITLASQTISFFVMGIISVIIVISDGFKPTIYWLQLIYYLFAMAMLLLALGIFNATVTTLVRDYQYILQSLMRLLMYVSGTMLDMAHFTAIPGFIRQALELNPFYYLIEGFRDTLFSRAWFWEKAPFAIFFWSFTILVLIIGSHIHMKFRDQFADFV